MESMGERQAAAGGTAVRVIRYGKDEPLPERRSLCAGPLTAASGMAARVPCLMPMGALAGCLARV